MEHKEPPERVKQIDTPEGHQRLLKAEWRELAAFAWNKYLSEGRGAVIINLRRGRESGTGVQIPTSYVAEGSSRLAKLGGWPGDEIAEIVRQYDPRQEVVFIFMRLDGDVFHYLVSDELTPPQAHRAKSVKDR
ncbi:MAG TPA: hypothetical protein VNO14_17875 [Blastocatellia bacterium]|nr:hypothetical protein [Blastocatellia bacterium]